MTPRKQKMVTTANEAFRLRRSGLSYSEISKELFSKDMKSASGKPYVQSYIAVLCGKARAFQTNGSSTTNTTSRKNGQDNETRGNALKDGISSILRMPISAEKKIQTMEILFS